MDEYVVKSVRPLLGGWGWVGGGRGGGGGGSKVTAHVVGWPLGKCRRLRVVF